MSNPFDKSSDRIVYSDNKRCCWLWFCCLWQSWSFACIFVPFHWATLLCVLSYHIRCTFCHQFVSILLTWIVLLVGFYLLFSSCMFHVLCSMSPDIPVLLFLLLSSLLLCSNYVFIMFPTIFHFELKKGTKFKSLYKNLRCMVNWMEIINFL